MVKAKGEYARLLAPCCCIRWRMGRVFVNRVSAGVLQYVFVRGTLAIVTLILQATGRYCEGSWRNPSCGYVYVAIALNLSQFWAMLCLITFYHELRKDLAPLRPLAKFAVVKAVVFFSFWQSIVIAALVALNAIKPTFDYSADDVAKGLQVWIATARPTDRCGSALSLARATRSQDFLICIEMAGAALAHTYAFSYRDFFRADLAHVHTSGGGKHHTVGNAMLDLLPVDVLHEARHQMRAMVQRQDSVSKVAASGSAAAATPSSATTAAGAAAAATVEGEAAVAVRPGIASLPSSPSSPTSEAGIGYAGPVAMAVHARAVQRQASGPIRSPTAEVDPTLSPGGRTSGTITVTSPLAAMSATGPRRTHGPPPASPPLAAAAVAPVAISLPRLTGGASTPADDRAARVAMAARPDGSRGAPVGR